MTRLQELTRKQIIVFSSVVLTILFAASVAIYSACHSHVYPQDLVVADSLCDSNPDSAVALLKKIPQTTFKNDADRMYYSLVRIKLSNNLYEPQKDSTIFRIVEFFDDMGDGEKLCQAYYYQGKYYIQHNDAPQALRCFQSALSHINGNTSLSLKSKIYSQSGSIFHEQDLYDEAIEMYRKSFVLDSIQGDTLNMVNGMRDIAQAYRHKNEIERSIYCYNKAYRLSEKAGNIILTNSVLLSLASLYKSQGNLSFTHSLLSKVLPNISNNMKSPAYSLAADLFKKEGNLDSMYCYCQKLLTVGTVYAKEYATGEMYEYYSMKGDFGKAVAYMRMNRKLTDSIRTIDATQSVEKIHSLYNYSLKEKENNALKEKNHKRVVAFIVVSFILVSSLMFLLFINEHNKKKILKYELMNAHLEELSKASLAENESYKMRIREMSQELDKVSLMLAENKQEKASSKLQVYELIKASISKKKTISDKNWLQIEKAMDIVYPDFKKNLLFLSNISVHEYHICILVKLNFSNSDIATIMCRTTGTISFTRSMLYKKLLHKEGKARDFDLLISSL